ncbi:MAG: DUF4364 family protein [Clostridia bacterium]|nr:DUF4364 family protein [Clostridia bacterium]
MASLVGSIRNVKIFVLYLMQNINYPLDYVTINDIVMQNDYVMYIDFAEAFHEMLDADLIEICEYNESGDPLYMVTNKGRIVATELRSEVLTSLLDKSLECALRYLDFKKRGIKISCKVEKREDGRYDVICIIKERDDIIMQNNVVVDSLNRAKRMEDNFRDHPEIVYKGVMALLSGNINFIFN